MCECTCHSAWGEVRGHIGRRLVFCFLYVGAMDWSEVFRLASSTFTHGAISLAHRGLCVSLIPSHHKLAVILPHTAHCDILLLHRSNPMEPANHWAEVYEMEPHRSFPVRHLCHSLAVIKKLTNTDFGFFFFPQRSLVFMVTLRSSLIFWYTPVPRSTASQVATSGLL